jgi:hypothetical protein
MHFYYYRLTIPKPLTSTTSTDQPSISTQQDENDSDSDEQSNLTLKLIIKISPNLKAEECKSELSIGDRLPPEMRAICKELKIITLSQNVHPGQVLILNITINEENIRQSEINIVRLRKRLSKPITLIIDAFI